MSGKRTPQPIDAKEDKIVIVNGISVKVTVWSNPQGEYQLVVSVPSDRNPAVWVIQHSSNIDFDKA